MRNWRDIMNKIPRHETLLLVDLNTKIGKEEYVYEILLGRYIHEKSNY